jgi:hypothetical protein
VRKEQIIGLSGASDAGSFYIIHKAWNGSQLIDLISKEELQPVLQKFGAKVDENKKEKDGRIRVIGTD